VAVVDNASLDGSAEMVQAEYPHVVLHANKKNVGYGAAANQAMASCGTRGAAGSDRLSRRTRKSGRGGTALNGAGWNFASVVLSPSQRHFIHFLRTALWPSCWVVESNGMSPL
jgi:hypothetical protein